MLSVVLPNTSLTVSCLGFGTASLHHLLRSVDRQTLLETAFDNGFTHFDTAPLYGDGATERELGKFLADKREKVTIGTKFGLPPIPLFERFPLIFYVHRTLGKIGRRFYSSWDTRPRDLSFEGAEASLTASLNRLNTDYIDFFFLHEPLTSDLDQVQLLAPWLEQQKTNGTVRYLGLAGNAENCLTIAQKMGDLFDVLQVEDSLIKREADLITHAGRPLQITFGYLRQAAQTFPSLSGEDIIRQALERNSQGMVLVSSRRHQRLSEIAALAS